jgi:hypothetical protein
LSLFASHHLARLGDLAECEMNVRELPTEVDVLDDCNL